MKLTCRNIELNYVKTANVLDACDKIRKNICKRKKEYLKNPFDKNFPRYHRFFYITFHYDGLTLQRGVSNKHEVPCTNFFHLKKYFSTIKKNFSALLFINDKRIKTNLSANTRILLPSSHSARNIPVNDQLIARPQPSSREFWISPSFSRFTMKVESYRIARPPSVVTVNDIVLI